jgi:hypothetical protein
MIERGGGGGVRWRNEREKEGRDEKEKGKRERRERERERRARERKRDMQYDIRPVCHPHAVSVWVVPPALAAQGNFFMGIFNWARVKRAGKALGYQGLHHPGLKTTTEFLISLTLTK